MAKKDSWMWSRPAPAWITYGELVRQMAARNYHETWRNQLHGDVCHMWFLAQRDNTADRYIVAAHSACTQWAAMFFEPEGQNITGTFMRRWINGREGRDDDHQKP